MLNTLKSFKSLFVVFTVVTLVMAAFYSSRNIGVTLSKFSAEEDHAQVTVMVNLVEEILHEPTTAMHEERISQKHEVFFPDHINLSIPTLIFDLTKPPSYS